MHAECRELTSLFSMHVLVSCLDTVHERNNLCILRYKTSPLQSSIKYQVSKYGTLYPKKYKILYVKHLNGN